jgi:quercetin dioxygenase-like cupin family protein
LKLAIFLLLLSTAFAQDIASVAPNNVKIEYEDAHVRVVRLKMAPHQKLPMQERPPRVVVQLTRNHVELTGDDGTTRTIDVPVGRLGWSGPSKRSVTNLETAVENIIVEPKNVTAPAIPVTKPPSPDDPRALIEPHHKWVFENQYVRVYDVRIPPGETTGYHTHGYDTVLVEITEGLTSQQVQGGEWQKPDKNEAGAVEFLPDSKKTRVHRVKNDGNNEFHVVLVQLMK